MEGVNSRLDELQAAILLTKLRFLPDWNRQRTTNAAQYYNRLKNVPEIILPLLHPDCTHTFHMFVIQCKNRDDLKIFLEKNNIHTGIHYPAALHNLPAYNYLNHSPSDFPIANQLQDKVLSLPIYPELSSEQIDFVCDKIIAYYRER